MKKILSILTMMLLFVGVTSAQGLNDDHTVSLHIQDWSYVNVLGDNVAFDVNTLTDGAPQNANGEHKYSQTTAGIEWGTNSNSSLAVTVQMSAQTPAGVGLYLRTDQSEMSITEAPFTLGSGGTFSSALGYGVDLPATAVPVVQGVNRGGGDTPLRYDLYVQHFQSDEVGNFDETVTYTIGAN